MFYLDKKKKKLQYTFGEDLASSTCLVFQMAEAVPAVYPLSCCVLAVLGVVCPWQMLLCAATAAGGTQGMQLVAPSFLHAENCHCRGTGGDVLPGFLPLPCYEQNASSWNKADLALWVRTGCALPLVMFFLQGTQVWHQILRHLVSSHTCTRHWCPTEHTKHFIRISRIPLNFFISHGNAIISSSSMRKWKVSRKLAFQCAKMHREGECLLIVPSQCCPTHPWRLCQ